VIALSTTPPPARPSERWEVGDAYETYMGRWSRLVAADFVEWLHISPGGVWLDVGCGTGALTGAICEIAAPLAVSGVDASADLLAHAADLACGDLADFQIADASDLPFADGIFDVVVSGLVLNDLPDLTAALREQARVVAPRGVVAAYVWDYAEGMRLLRHFWAAARSVSPTAAALDEAVRFAGANPRDLGRAFEAAGLDLLGVRAIEVTAVFRDFDELWAPFLRGQGPAPRFVAGLDPAEVEALRARLAAAVPVLPDGSIGLTARAWAIAARA
jgi:SAM-dependent methyltransferase